MHRLKNRPLAVVPAVIALAVIALPVLGAAQNAPNGAPSPYRPGLGDLMTATVQPRHIKIALAAKEKNWPLAAYELHQLAEAFDRVASTWPSWRTVPIAGIIGPVTQEPMAALLRAVKDKDSDRFTAAFGTLTAACNACHQASNVGFLAIKTPDASPFPDQDFRPEKP